MKLMLLLLLIGGVALYLYSRAKNLTIWEALTLLIKGESKETAYLAEQTQVPYTRLRIPGLGEIKINLPELFKG